MKDVFAESLFDRRFCGMMGSLGSGLMLNELVALLARETLPEVDPKLASRELRRLGRDVFSFLRPFGAGEDICVNGASEVARSTSSFALCCALIRARRARL